MNIRLSLHLACLVATAAALPSAHADSFTSSASSAGSASSGSVSDSLQGSSNSSTRDEKTADGNYRIVQVATASDRPGVARVTLAAEGADRQLVLSLPQAIVERQRLVEGHVVKAQNRAYGIEFAHADTKQAFYLVLADEWHAELAPRLVGV